MDLVQLRKVREYLEKYGALNNSFNDYSKLYIMTTENINGFLSRYDLKDKNILTVAGSGDQRLNTYLLGANNVDCFDINPITELHLKLKDTAIKNIGFEKFIYFFDIYTNKYNKEYDSLDPRIFREFKDELDEDAKLFYNYVLNKSIYLRCRDIYIDFDNDYSVLRNMNNYLELDKYYELRNILNQKKINFIKSDIKDLPDKLEGKKYDMILLSNISDYVHHVYPDKSLENFRNLIEKLKQNLNMFGIIQIGYIYSMYARGEDISDFHFNDDRHKYFPTSEFKSVFVDSYYGDGSYDKVITYQKLGRVYEKNSC